MVSTVVIIPAYNEGARIGEVVRGVRETVPEYDVLVVDDGSRDNTGTGAMAAGAEVISHPFNLGYGVAIQTGYKYALAQEYEYLVQMDGDGQHDPSCIPRLLAPVMAGETDFALGSRFLGRAHNIPQSRKVVLTLGIWFTRLVSRVRISDVHNGLRAFSRPAATSLHIHMDRMAHASEILDQIREAHWRYQEVPVSVYYSPYSLSKGQSSWNALKIGFELLFGKLAK